MTQEATRKMVEAGIIPKNVIQHLGRYGLVPEDYVELHGSRPVSLDTSDKQEVDSFIGELSEAISKDMAAIQETTLDDLGGFKHVYVRLNSGTNALDFGKDGTVDPQGNFICREQILVDRFGRAVVPVSDFWRTVSGVSFDKRDEIREIVKTEERHEGDKVVALVLYLGAKGGNGAKVA